MESRIDRGRWRILGVATRPTRQMRNHRRGPVQSEQESPDPNDLRKFDTSKKQTTSSRLKRQFPIFPAAGDPLPKELGSFSSASTPCACGTQTQVWRRWRSSEGGRRGEGGGSNDNSQFSQFEPFKERNEERLRDEEVKKRGSAPGGGGGTTDTQNHRGGSSATPLEYGGGEGRGRGRDQASVPMMARISSPIKVHFTLKRTYRPHAVDSLSRRRNVRLGNSPGLKGGRWE